MRKRIWTRWPLPPLFGMGLALLVMGCDAAPTAVQDRSGSQEVVLEFGVHHPAHIIWRGIDRLDDVIEVRDNFEVFCWPYTPDATAAREGSGLVVRLTGRPVDGCPQDVALGVSYRARVRLPDGLEPAFVRVEHRWSNIPDRTYSVLWD
jgi:hypothetical protein